MNMIQVILENKKLPDKSFLRKCGLSQEKLPDSIAEMISQASTEKNADDLEACLYLVFRFKCYSSQIAETVNRLITEDWHHCHEDMASILQVTKLPSSVDALLIAAKTKYDYLEYDDSYGLASKCIWALGAIRNPSAVNALILLSKSDKKAIAECAQEQLERIRSK